MVPAQYLIFTLFFAVVWSQQPSTTPVPILKQINRQNDDGSYSYGYENADGSFKIETKYTNGEVYGKYGYVDAEGKGREVEYGAPKRGFEPAGTGIDVPPPTLVNENALQNADYDDGQYREDPSIYWKTDKFNSVPAAKSAPSKSAAPAPAPAPSKQSWSAPQQQTRSWSAVQIVPVLMIFTLFFAVVWSQQPSTTPVPILKQINRQNDDGSYSYGYENADGSFKIETKYTNGEVYGKYGYVDAEGKVREVEYGATKRGFEPAGTGIDVPPPTLVNENALQNADYDDGQYREDPSIYWKTDKFNSVPAAKSAPSKSAAPAPAPAPSKQSWSAPQQQTRSWSAPQQ
ncbi:uncharacterized protein LOC103514108, partial [Diaphorina citri]|uniref:Uncharacterized protein LOC103514108 n=1 Tax=Diaphorina citri TaxID=121845 RepID=A0A3Q0J3A1_DIACI